MAAISQPSSQWTTTLGPTQKIESNQYSKVHVLLLAFENTTTADTEKLHRLARAIAGDNKWEVDQVFLPLEQPDGALKEIFGAFERCFSGPEILLIIIYSGCGASDMSGLALSMLARTDARETNVNWSNFHPQFQQCTSDILLLLDACSPYPQVYSADSMSRSTNTVDVPRAKGRLSFLDALIKEFSLKARSSNILPLFELCMSIHQRTRRASSFLYSRHQPLMVRTGEGNGIERVRTHLSKVGSFDSSAPSRPEKPSSESASQCSEDYLGSWGEVTHKHRLSDQPERPNMKRSTWVGMKTVRRKRIRDLTIQDFKQADKRRKLRYPPRSPPKPFGWSSSAWISIRQHLKKGHTIWTTDGNKLAIARLKHKRVAELILSERKIYYRRSCSREAMGRPAWRVQLGWRNSSDKTRTQ